MQKPEYTETVESLSTDDVYAKPPMPMLVPIRELNAAENICCGFRQSGIALRENGQFVGGVDTGLGCGTDAILLKWGEKSVLIRASELLKAWVATFDQAAAARLPGALVDDAMDEQAHI